jgi:hypothetical protein
MAMATKRAVAMETRVVSKDVGNGEGSKSNGKGSKSDGNGNEEGNCEEEGNEQKRRSGRKKSGGGGRSPTAASPTPGTKAYNNQLTCLHLPTLIGWRCGW